MIKKAATPERHMVAGLTKLVLYAEIRRLKARRIKTGEVAVYSVYSAYEVLWDACNLLLRSTSNLQTIGGKCQNTTASEV